MDYTNQVLRVVVAQICQTIGWHSIQSTPLELLVDILHKYLQEISRETYRHTELYGRTEPNLVDVGLAFRNLSINLSDIEEYINYVDCVACSIDVPKYPVRKESNLNFLKPGSKEVLTRPVHIPEYLPPIYPEKEEGQTEAVKKEPGTEVSNTVDVVTLPSNENTIFKKPEITENVAKKPKIFVEDEGRPTREISSVMMTSSGFISPAREGKLPDTKAPVLPEYKSPPPPPPLAAIMPQTLPVGNIDSKFDKKEKKKKTLPSDKEGRKKEKVLKDSHKKLAHSGDTTTPIHSEKLKALKKQKNKQKHRGGDHQMDINISSDNPGLLDTMEINTSGRNDATTSSQLPSQSTQPPPPVPMDLDIKPKVDEIKLSSEPSKEKLNIFKKISTAKKERDDMSRSPNIFHDSYIFSSIPEGTTITPAPPLKHYSHHQQHQQQQQQTQSLLVPQQLDDDPVICVDDEPNYSTDLAKNIPVPLPPGTTIKAQTPKKPRKSKQQQQTHLDPNLPLNLSSEITASPAAPVNMVKKDIIQNSRLSYPTFPPQKPLKEKKERRKPKTKEPKQKDIIPSAPAPLNIPPQVGSSTATFDEKNLKNFRENAASLFFKNCAMGTKMGAPGKSDSILPNPGANPYGGPANFPNVHAPIPMFPFYPFPTRPGLIPNPGLFPPLQPMPDSPAFNKFLPMMRFGNFGNINKGPRLTSTYDDEPPPLPPIDTEKSYCNVAPLVPESMKFQLSPTRLKSKSGTATTSSTATTSGTLGGGGEPGTSSSGAQQDPCSSKVAKTNLDSPIEISDDENIKTGNENKYSDGAEQNPNNGDVTMKDLNQTGGECFTGETNVEDVTEDRKEKSEKRKDKMHKKGKKEKEGKIKKKKDKKDKSKSKDKAEKRKEKEEKKNKDRIKKLKKEKKKDKMRSRAYSGEECKLDTVNPDTSHNSTVPKLTLKIGLGNSPQPDSPDGRKLSIKSHSDDMTDSFDDVKVASFDRRESSPELARISPLVTRPPKQKSSSTDNLGSIAPPPANHASVIDGRFLQSNIAGNSPTTSSVAPPSCTFAATGTSASHMVAQKSLHYSNYDAPSSSHTIYQSDNKKISSDFNKSPFYQYESHGGGIGGVGTGGGGGGSIAGSVTIGGNSGAADISGSHSSRNHPAGVSTTFGTTGLRHSQSSATFLLSAVESNRPSSYIDADGNQVWICPACGRVDDGTPMIGCDGCDAWYHWVCVGIQVPPDDNEDWYCRVCIAKKQEAHGADKKRKRKKKNKAN